jgi:WD40 repeat protein
MQESLDIVMATD